MARSERPALPRMPSHDVITMTTFGRRMPAFVLGAGACQAFFAATSVHVHDGAANHAAYKWRVNPNANTEAVWLSANAERQATESRLRRQVILVGVALACASGLVLLRRPEPPGSLTIGRTARDPV
jgi:hypothetical protein